MRNLLGYNDQVWLYIDQFATVLGLVALILSIVLATLGYVYRDLILNRLARNRFPNIGIDHDDSQHSSHDAVIFIVTEDVSQDWVLGLLKPKYVGILGTLGGNGFISGVGKLKTFADDAGCHVVSELMSNPTDIKEAKRKIEYLFSELTRMGANHCVVDLTGGSIPMSLGAFMAAEENSLSTLYVDTQYENGLPKYETSKVVRVSDVIGK